MHFIKLIFFLSLFFLNPNYSIAKVVFIDIDLIVNGSDIGKKINKKFEEKILIEEKKFFEQEKNLKKKEEDIIKQKNILSKEELDKQIINLRKEIDDYRNKKISVTNDLRSTKLKQTNSLVKSLNQILSDYAEKNSVSMIIQKKNIVMGKTELDITKEVLKIFNDQVKKLEN